MKSLLLRVGLMVILVVGMGWSNVSAAENENPSFQEINRLLTNEAIKRGIPPEVLKAVAWEESNWRQFVGGKPYISSDGGIGIMQITNKAAYDQSRLKTDIAYNIQAGAEILNEMYGRGDLPKLGGATKSVIESWYFPVMAYNGTKPVNSPLYKSSGKVNSSAYQEKVYQDLREHLLAGRLLAKYPFKVSDFEYDSNSTKNIVFKKKLYTLSDIITTSHAGFIKGSKVVTTGDVQFRKTPEVTEGNKLGTLKKGTVLTIRGNHMFDKRTYVENQFVWYPVKKSSGENGYVSSAYLAKTIFTVNKVTDQSTKVTGNVAKGYSITVSGSDKVKNRGISSAQQNYSLAISSKLKQGTKLTFTLKDANGLVHQKKTISVTDGTPPSKPKVNTIDDNDIVIKGNAEKGSMVYAHVNGKSIGSAKADGKTGNYNIKISKQKAGTKVLVKAKDAAGNFSSGNTLTVIDKTPPGKPKVNTIDDNDTTIKGTAEKGSRVYAYVSGKSIGNAKASSSGTYSIKITKKKAGTKIILKAKDAAGNYSSGRTMTVVDKTPPAAPKVNKVTSKTTKVTGTAEKNGTVKVYRGSTHLKTATVNAKGSYSLAIKAQKKGTVLSVYAYDKAKNKSKPTKVTVK